MAEGNKTHHEVIVIGAGVAGIYQIKRLADLGVDALVLDAAPDSALSWTADHRYGNATTGQFVALAERISGQDLGSFFQTWLWDKTKPATFS